MKEGMEDLVGRYEDQEITAYWGAAETISK